MDNISKERVEAYRESAEQGNADAQHNLGMLYHHGMGVTQDYAEAVKWYRQAAEQWHDMAQLYLGEMYEAGEGMPEDDVGAYAWFSVAAAPGWDEARKSRDLIKRKLTPSQLDRGQVMAREIFERIEKRKAAEGE